MGYKYQLHTHTSPCSKCGAMTPAELARALYEGGYSGAVITNHFKGGNTGIDRALVWEKFVAAYEADYLACRSEGEKYGLDIIFGIEEHLFGGVEILCYGITPSLLYAHPELDGAGADLWYKILHAHGALVIQAHPFRERAYITHKGVLPLEYIDGIEVYNAGNAPQQNDEAIAFAEGREGMIFTSGADAHRADNVCVAGIECAERISSGEQLVRVLRSGEYSVLK